MGILILAIFAAKKFNLGDKIISGFTGFGSTIGQSITGIPTGFLAGLTGGGEGLGKQAASLSEGFQRSIIETLFGKSLLFSETQGFGGTGQVGGTVSGGAAAQPSNIVPTAPPRSQIIDLSKFFSDLAVKRRIAGQITKATPRLDTSGEGFIFGGTPFGGFGSAIKAETALQKAIRESAERFPQFFR